MSLPCHHSKGRMALAVLLITLVATLHVYSSHAFTPKQSRVKSASSLGGTDYRLWDEERPFPLPGIMGRQTQWVFNTVADLLSITGEGSEFYPEISKSLLIDALEKTGKNGLKASDQQRKEIEGLVDVLEAGNPTLNPARATKKMEGNWQMLYTDLVPAAPSSGKLGPFTGDVYQELDPSNGIIKNLLNIDLPGLKISGGLVAKQSIFDKETWRIDFDYVSNGVEVAGIPLGAPNKKPFETGKETRLWKITYLDDNLRVLRARRLEAPEKDSFIFVLRRVENLPLDASKI